MQGSTQSCGCIQKSKGEDKIKILLNKLNINYIYQKTFKDCYNPKTNYLLRFDFYLPDYNILIEYDGEQHFDVRKHGWFTEKAYQEIKERDQLKNKYCREKNIPLLRIPYTDYNILNENYLLDKINICR